MKSFKEFIDPSSNIDEDTKELFVALSESHPVLKNNATIQRIISNRSPAVSLHEITRVNKDILARSVTLARQAASATLDKRILILCEQSLLNTIASTISAAVSAQSQQAIDRLSKITSALR